MEIKKGQNRVVLIFPKLKIAIKFPLVRFYLTIKELFCYKNDWDLLRKRCTWPIEAPGFKRFLLGGAYANWNEFYFYLKTRHPFIQPTYFSLFGLLNVQMYDEPCRAEWTNFFTQLDELTDRKASEDPHHFANPRNFCLHDGKLRMLDYGGRKARDVITRYGVTIHKKFNPM